MLTDKYNQLKIFEETVVLFCNIETTENAFYENRPRNYFTNAHCRRH